MATRLQLQSDLENILGSRNVYYQPPENYQMKYPCIVYRLSQYDTIYADNTPYAWFKSYQLTIISRDADIPCVEELLKLQYCRFDRMYTSDGLYHYVYKLYY